MSKAKIIIIAICIVACLLFYVAVYLYITNLNKQIVKLNNEIIEQNNTIENLKCDINILKTDILVKHDTLNATSDYIESIDKIYAEDMNIKQAISTEVINNEDVQDWFNEKLPETIMAIINDSSSDDNRMCKAKN